MEIPFKRYKTLKETKEKIWSWKCNDWNENYTRGIQRFEQAEERISKLEDRTIDIIKPEEQKKND